MAYTVPTNDPTDYTLVYVYASNGNSWDFRQKPARYVRCPECGADYSEMHWDDNTCPGDGAMLVCECGEQFTQRND